jgi:hypothetical protein
LGLANANDKVGERTCSVEPCQGSVEGAECRDVEELEDLASALAGVAREVAENETVEDRTATQDEKSANEWAQRDIEMVTWIGGGGAEIWRVESCGVGVGGLRGSGLAFEGVMLR